MQWIFNDYLISHGDRQMVIERTNYRIRVYSYIQNAERTDDWVLAKTSLPTKEKIQLLGIPLNDLYLGK